MLYMFDFDGTIVNSRGIGRRTIIKMLEKYNKEFTEEEVYARQYTSFENMIECLRDEYFSDLSMEDMYSKFGKESISLYVLLQPKEHFLSYLNSLQGKVIIATRNDARVITAWLETMKLDIEVIAEYDVKLRKDDLAFYDLMSSKFNVDKKDMVLFEDDAKNIEAANKAGVKAVGIYAEQNDERLEMIKENSVILINDYDELINKNIV